MPLIPFPPLDEAGDELAALYERIRRREAQLVGTPEVADVWRAMAHVPAYLRANWERSRAIMQRGDLPALTKEMVAVAVSAVNRCHY